MRPWLRTVLKVVVMGTTMCSGIIVATYDVLTLVAKEQAAA